MSKTVRVRVETAQPYDVRIGCGILGELAEELKERDAVCVLTDENVQRLHGSAVTHLEERARIVVAPGEDSKSFSRLERVLDGMVECGLSRASCLVAFGGGVIGDLGGLAASLYQRGIDAACKSPQRCSPRSTPRSGARRRSISPVARTWRGPSTNRFRCGRTARL